MLQSRSNTTAAGNTQADQESSREERQPRQATTGSRGCMSKLTVAKEQLTITLGLKCLWNENDGRLVRQRGKSKKQGKLQWGWGEEEKGQGKIIFQQYSPQVILNINQLFYLPEFEDEDPKISLFLHTAQLLSNPLPCLTTLCTKDPIAERSLLCTKIL